MAHHQYVINVNVNWQLSCGFVMIIVQSWMGVRPAGIEWTISSVSGE